ncbi:hypothetical protein PCANC_17983 [Puccinia coronata f. sp. avenae]|uniref:Uncharacterized protein n=1 Tax=Puccinia coronata f. sp. avenae TaxID=200324 RepID=A0A2N5SJD2_9BASI|nr:hypothetical protein PCANC_17983 [Puccinia coronata f. sp. avenae]
MLATWPPGGPRSVGGAGQPRIEQLPVALVSPAHNPPELNKVTRFSSVPGYILPLNFQEVTLFRPVRIQALRPALLKVFYVPRRKEVHHLTRYALSTMSLNQEAEENIYLVDMNVKSHVGDTYAGQRKDDLRCSTWVQVRMLPNEHSEDYA